MVSQIISRLNFKARRLWFSFCQANHLKGCGKNAHLYSPFRLDGAENISIGADTVLQSGGWLFCCPPAGKTGSMEIGSGCVFGYNNHITAVRNVVIEDHVLTANNVYISDNLHSYEDIYIPVMHQPVRFKKAVLIGRGSWIGENVSVIGARVGRNCVIGANAVVTRDIPDYSVAVGAPAVVIRRYDQNTQKWVAINKGKIDS